MNRRQVAAILATGILLAPSVAPALAAVQTVLVGGGTPVSTQSGLEVKPGSDQQLNLETPWKSSNEVKFRGVTFRGSSASVTVDNFGNPNGGKVWTNLSAIDASSGVVHVDRDGEDPVGASGTVSELRVRQYNLTENGQEVDIVATAGGDWELYVNDTGLSQGRGVIVQNADTGETLDAAGVDANGNVEFEDLPAVTDAELNIEKGASELLVFFENEPSKLVNNADLRVRVFSTDEVFERQVTNGRMDLTGVPSDQRLSITVSDDSDQFVYRRITIPSASEQGEVYLLNESAPDKARVEFSIRDRTGGEFQPDKTRFLIEKPVTKDFDSDGSNETRYQTVAGDVLGNTRGFGSTLQEDERYRLRVENDAGDSRQLGSYVVRGPANPTVEIGRVIINSDGDAGYAADLQQFSEDVDNDGVQEQFIRVAYRDTEERTTQFNYRLINESSGNTIEDTTISGPLGTHTQTIQVGTGEIGSSYRLNWTADRQTANGTQKQISGERFAGDIPEIASQLPIDPRWLELVGLVSIVAVAGLIVIFDSSLAALVTTGWAGVLTLLGIVAIPIPALGLAGAVSVLALIGRS